MVYNTGVSCRGASCCWGVSGGGGGTASLSSTFLFSRLPRRSQPARPLHAHTPIRTNTIYANYNQLMGCGCSAIYHNNNNRPQNRWFIRFIHSFFHSGDLYSNSSRHYYSAQSQPRRGLQGDVKFWRLASLLMRSTNKRHSAFAVSGM